jgi:hypothetical protein
MRADAIAAPLIPSDALGPARKNLKESRLFARVPRKYFPKIRMYVILLIEDGAPICAPAKRQA